MDCGSEVASEGTKALPSQCSCCPAEIRHREGQWSVCGGGSGLQQSTHGTHICLYTGSAALWVVHCLNKHVALAVRLQCQMPTDEMYEGFVVPKPR